MVDLDDQTGDRFAGSAAADERVDELDRRRRSDRTSAAMQAAMSALTAEDRVVLRFRYAHGKSIADIARLLGIEQRPLYRRIERLLGELRAALERQGLDAGAVADLIGGSNELLDFGAAFGKSDGVQPSLIDERGSSGGESS
jgi:RNA polymerase sigma factor for flagellar operon FliA